MHLREKKNQHAIAYEQQSPKLLFIILQVIINYRQVIATLLPLFIAGTPDNNYTINSNFSTEMISVVVAQIKDCNLAQLIQAFLRMRNCIKNI